jgi:peptidyl-prolyl cis-trans isomerase C
MQRPPIDSTIGLALRLFCLMTVAIGGPLFLLSSCTPPPSEERVVAFVNGRPITKTEFDSEWNDLPEANRTRYEKEGGKQLFLNELVDNELLMQEARKQGLDQSDAFRDRVRRYKEKLLKEELLKDRMKAAVEPTKEELDRYYEQHASELLTPLKVRVAQMLLPNLPAAKDLETQVNRGGDFGKFAQRYSIDMKTKAKGGDLGPYRKGLVIPEVDEVLRSLKPGMICAPIKTEAGYYLVKITALEPEIIQADLAKRERLRQELVYLKRKQHYDEAIAEIKAKAVVRLFDSSQYSSGDLTKR